MVKPSAGRASILGAQVINDTYGTALALSANTVGSVLVPDGCIGAMVYSPNVPYRMRVNAEASTALTWPVSGYFRASTEYGFALNPSRDNLSFIATVAGTPQVTWIQGAGA